MRAEPTYNSQHYLDSTLARESLHLGSVEQGGGEWGRRE